MLQITIVFTKNTKKYELNVCQIFIQSESSDMKIKSKYLLKKRVIINEIFYILNGKGSSELFFLQFLKYNKWLSEFTLRHFHLSNNVVFLRRKKYLFKKLAISIELHIKLILTINFFIRIKTHSYDLLNIQNITLKGNLCWYTRKYTNFISENINQSKNNR